MSCAPELDVQFLTVLELLPKKDFIYIEFARTFLPGSSLRLPSSLR